MDGWMDGWVYWGQQSRSRGSQGQQRGAEGVTEVKQMDIWGKGRHFNVEDLGYCFMKKISESISEYAGRHVGTK